MTPPKSPEPRVMLSLNRERLLHTSSQFRRGSAFVVRPHLNHKPIIQTNTMGAAYFIVLEREIDGLDTFINGKSLSKEIDSLDEAARRLGVRPLSEFFSIDPEQAAEFADMDVSEVKLPPLSSFPQKMV